MATDLAEGLPHRRLVLRASAMLAFMFPFAVRGQSVEVSPLRASLDISVADPKHVLATIVKVNVSKTPIWILKDPPGVFVECEGREMRNIGPSDKRAAYKMDDYERVLPGQSVTRQLDLVDQFQWLPGTHTYVASTGGGYVDPTADDHFTPGTWAKTQFTLTR